MIQDRNELSSKSMGTDPPGRLILRYALPSIFTMVISSLYNVVDKIFIGQGVGYLGLAATTASTSVMMLIGAFGALVGTGAGIRLSMALGRKEYNRAERVLSISLMLETVIGLLLLAGGCLFLGPICRLTGAGAEAFPYVKQYLRVIFLGSVFSCLSTGLLPVIRAEGCPREALLFGCAGSVCNCVLDPVFIFGLKMGIRGAAIATILSQLLSAALVVRFLLFGRKSGLRPARDIWDTALVREILRLGFPGFLMNVIMCMMVLVFTNTLKHYGSLEVSGDTAISSLGLSTSIGDLITTISIGMQEGLSPLVAYNYSARKFDRVRRIFRLGFVSLLLLLLLFWAVLEIWPETLIRLFGEAGDMDFAVYTVRIYNLALPLLVVQLFGNMFLQSTGQVKAATVVALARNVFFGIPLLLLLPLFWGVYGAMAMGPLADTGGAIVSALLTARVFRRMETLSSEEECAEEMRTEP